MALRANAVQKALQRPFNNAPQLLSSIDSYPQPYAKSCIDEHDAASAAASAPVRALRNPRKMLHTICLPRPSRVRPWRSECAGRDRSPVGGINRGHRALPVKTNAFPPRSGVP